MDRFPELVQYKIADYSVPKHLRDAFIKLCTDPTYTNEELKGYYAPGRNCDPANKTWHTCESGRMHSVHTIPVWRAAQAGNLPLAKWLYENGEPVERRAMVEAARSANVAVVKWLIGLGVGVSTIAIRTAAEQSSIPVLEALYAANETQEVHENILHHAILYAECHVIEWLLQRRHWRSSDAYLFRTGVQRRGSDATDTAVLDLLERYIGPPRCDESLMRKCYGCGTVAVAEWLVARGAPVVMETVDAVRNLPMLQWAVAHGAVLNAMSFTFAAQYTHACLVWVAETLAARGVDVPLDPGPLVRAVSQGQLRNVQWLRARGHQWTEEMSGNAVGTGAMRLALLDWMRANGCPFTAWAFSTAVYLGNEGTIAWMKANSVPFDETTYMYALRFGTRKLVRWLDARRSKFSPRYLA